MAHGLTVNDNRDIRLRAWHSHYVHVQLSPGKGVEVNLRDISQEKSVFYMTLVIQEDKQHSDLGK